METLPEVLCKKIYDYVSDLYYIEHVHRLKKSLVIMVFMKKNYLGFHSRWNWKNMRYQYTKALYQDSGM